MCAWASLAQQHNEGGHQHATHAAYDDDGQHERHNMFFGDGTELQVMCNVSDHVSIMQEPSQAATVLFTCQPCLLNRRHGAWHN